MAATTTARGAGGKRGKRRLCGVPAHECCGSRATLAPGLSELKSHATPEQAFECYRAWLLRQGYRQIGSREFETPGQDGIVMLTRKSRFGAMLRGGKEGRYMSDLFLGGTIIG
jgi:hypothetical protein